ncbi:low molecular weight phosphotyrosine protein phosphatase [Myroides marinus]|uniref:low molecular weight protein-tyrosine-phosphatase n=1 Tax=Myroides marinus TaxID=703342 RepID=UPI002574D6DB|nr:low molecular weight protein-tyrosine-phosphatase [Myroides marinus]MDM1502942.1 low molecular weight phosphotyrosine protein phosphatase [Myroides marinus]
MTKVLMVCLGNICRSPLAEGILQSKLSLESFFVDSAGTGDWHIGSQPDKRSIAVAKKYNIDLTTQRARQFKVKDFDTFDRIYVMDKSNYDNVIKLAPTNEAKSKVKLILNEITPGQNAEVPDPYFGGEDGFEHVYQLLDEVCNVIAKDLKS